MKRFIFIFFLFAFVSSQGQIRTNPFYVAPVSAVPATIVEDPNILALQSMGSTIKALAIGFNPVFIPSTATLTDNRIWFIPVYLHTAATITGVMFYQGTQGDYTADNNNKIGLYSFSGGTITLVASCADDGNLWKGTANTYISKAFSSTYVATAGIYYVGIVYNSSAEVTVPRIGNVNSMVGTGVSSLDFTNSNMLSSYVAGNDFPNSVALNTLTKSNSVWWVAIY